MHPKSESAWEHLACAIQAYHGFFEKRQTFSGNSCNICDQPSFAAKHGLTL